MSQPEPEVIEVIPPSPKGYRLIAENYRHEILQRKLKPKAIVERMRAFTEIAIFLTNHPEEYAILMGKNPFARKPRTWKGEVIDHYPPYAVTE